MLSRGVALLCCLLVAGSALRADDLTSLVHEYNDALAKVGGRPQDRKSKVAEHVVPVLRTIAAVGSDAAIGWLAGELDKKNSLTEVRAAIPAAIVAGAGDNAARVLLRGFSRRPLDVQTASLRALGEWKGEIGVEDAKQIIGQLDAEISADGGEGGDVLVAAVALLKKTKDAALREWLADEAYSVAGSAPGRLFVLARLAAELPLDGARAQLAKLVGHRSPSVAGAAIEALGKIGVGDTSEEIARAVTRGKGDLTTRIRALDTLAAGGGTGVDVVIEAARSRDAELRAVAMGSLALAVSNPRALDALLAGLGDKDPSVRAVALRSISRLRVKPMFGALIGALEPDKDPSFQVKLVETLVRVSGQNFGLAVEDWKKWWTVSEASFEFPKADDKSFTQVKQYDLSYFGIEVSSKRLGFLVDVSSSMREMVAVKEGSLDDDEKDGARGRTRVGRGGGGDAGGKEKEGKAMKIDVLKKELSRLLRKLPADTHINIVNFDGDFAPWQKNLQPLAGAGRAKAVGYVEALNTGSGTNVFDTLEFALKDKRVDTIFLLTDGVPTRGRLTDPDAIIEEIKVLNRVRGVTIHTIAFGEESALLEKLAEQNGGQYRFVDRY